MYNTCSAYSQNGFIRTQSAKNLSPDFLQAQDFSKMRLIFAKYWNYLQHFLQYRFSVLKQHNLYYVFLGEYVFVSDSSDNGTFD